MNLNPAGNIVVARIDELRAQFADAAAATDVTIDLSAVKALDTAGAWLIIDEQAKIQERGGRCTIVGASKMSSS